MELPTYTFEPNLGGLLSLLITVALPLGVGLVTKQVTSAAVKATLLLALSAAKTFIEAWISAMNHHIPFQIYVVLINIIISFVIAVAVYFGYWKPTGAADKAQNTLVT